MHEALQLRYSGRACFDDDEQQKMEDEAASNVNVCLFVCLFCLDFD